MVLLLIGCNIQDIELKDFDYENIHSEIAIPFGTASYTSIELLSTVVDPSSMNTDSGSGILTFVDYETEEYLSNESIEIDSVSGGVRFTDHVHNLTFDIGSGLDFRELDSLVLRIISENGWPFSGIMDMYIVNDTEDTLYSAVSIQVLDIPFLNQDRTVREPKTSIDDIHFGEEGLTALAIGDKIRLAVTMNSPESKTAEDIFVILLAEAELEVTLAARGIINKKI